MDLSSVALSEPFTLSEITHALFAMDTRASRGLMVSAPPSTESFGLLFVMTFSEFLRISLLGLLIWMV